MGGLITATDVAVVKGWLERKAAIKVKVVDRIELPQSAYYKPRRRYRAERLLDELNRLSPKNAWRVMGLTAVDISTSKPPYDDWGVMGLGELPGKVSVLSVFRCRKGARSADHAYERLGKVAVHELGHTLGLDHCPTAGCLMEDAKGKASTVDSEQDFCPRCKAALGKIAL